MMIDTISYDGYELTGHITSTFNLRRSHRLDGSPIAVLATNYIYIYIYTESRILRYLFDGENMNTA